MPIYDPIYFYKTTNETSVSSEVRARGVFHKSITLTPPEYQPWENYPDSPELTATYPYQSVLKSPYYPETLLIMSTSDIYVYYAPELKFWVTNGIIYKYFGGAWVHLWGDGGSSTGWELTEFYESNHDIYWYALPPVDLYFAKTTNETSIFTNIRINT